MCKIGQHWFKSQNFSVNSISLSLSQHHCAKVYGVTGYRLYWDNTDM